MRKKGRGLAVGAAVGDGSEQEFGTKSPASQVSLDRGSRFLRGRTGIEKHDNGWASAAEGCAEHSPLPGQFLQAGEQGAECGTVRLVDAVFKRGRE
jgi:hypothetical protein